MGRHTLTFRVEVLVEPDEDGFHACCPALKGLHVDGDTEEEALRNARDAIEAYIGSLIKHGDPIPVGVMAPEACGIGPDGKPRPGQHLESLSVEYAYA